jgi:SAM-dependent methyltransferase
MGWFKDWFGTPYYALLYGHRDEHDARQWVESIKERWDMAPGTRLLDLACGRGRHARWFAEAGIQVTGIDISEASILEARNTAQGARFEVHDMRQFFAHQEFDAACCLFTSLGYFDTLADDRQVFASAHAALKPGGRLVIDFMNSPLVLSGLVPQEEFVRSGVRFKVSRSIEDGIIVKRIDVQDGVLASSFEERVQALVPEQLEAMAQEAGFIVDGRTDGPVCVPFDPQRSSRFVLWLTKPVV